MPSGSLTAVIEGYTPRTVSPSAACFARAVVARAAPETPTRAKALLFAASRLGAFAEAVGLELDPSVVLHRSVIERCCASGVSAMSPATRRTLRSNLRALARRLEPHGAPMPLLSRERAKPPYSAKAIASYLALCDAQPTETRRLRAGALVCLGAGAGLVGGDLRAVRGTNVVARDGGLVVTVISGRRPRSVPVLARYHDRLAAAAASAGEGFVIGGTSQTRRNVTTPLTASLAGGADLARIEVARLRSTWLCEVAGAIGLKAFMGAAGITCSQRLGDLVAHLEMVDDQAAVTLLGGRR